VKAIHQRRNLEYEKQIELSQAEFNQKMDEYTSKVWVSPNFLPTVGLRPPFGRKFHIHKISSLVIIFLPVCVYFYGSSNVSGIYLSVLGDKAECKPQLKN
jgi:hypothetical protein